MIKTGLVSITFRKLSPVEIIRLVKKAGLVGIEWGGDIHVPHGNIRIAGEVAKMTTDAGLKVASYGSYYRVGCDEKEGASFEAVLETAFELKAPTIRVWAGDRGSAEADEAFWERVVDEARRISGIAKDTGITISFEYHGATLTDTAETAERLMKLIDRKNIFSYWQPPAGLDFNQQIESLNKITPWLGNIHVFWWKMYERLPLAEGEDVWRKYMDIISKVPGNRFCMMEFVMNDDPLRFLIDAKTLNNFMLWEH
jgi:3-dehydroshikimate dehydratase